MKASALSLGMPLRNRILSSREAETLGLDRIRPTDSGTHGLAKWREQRPFNNPEFLNQKLAMLGVSERAFLGLLSEDGGHLASRTAPPSWATLWLGLLSKEREAQPLGLPSNREPALLPFLDVLSPLIEEYAERLQSRLLDLSAKTTPPVFEPTPTFNALVAILVDRLLPLAEKALVFDLQIERLQGTLEGGTPQKRFEDFVSRIGSNSYRRRFLSEYPVIARQAVLTCDHWLEFSDAFVSDLIADWPLIEETFGRDSVSDRVVHVETAGGDCHQKGRVVLVVHFGNGEPLVYKPRCLDMESQFNSFLKEINRHRVVPQFYLPGVISFTDHGWMEFVEPRECSDEAALQRYYTRFGALIAITYILGASDLHHENIIAFGEHPVLVDLEALFHPTVETKTRSPLGVLVNSEVEDSVLSTGLLPMRYFASRNSGGIDLSALTSDFDRFLPNVYPFWEKIGTDEMALAYAPAVLRPSRNRPALKGRRAHPGSHANMIVDGFEAAATLIRDRRSDFRRPNEALARFADKRSRQIFRPTAIYGHLLQESYHPSLLRNAVDRERYFDQLWHQALFDPWLIQVIDEEQRQLWDNDVPVFYGNANSRDLDLGGGRSVRGFFLESGWEKHCRRIDALSPRKLERQKWFISASIGSAADNPHAFRAEHDSYGAPADPQLRNGRYSNDGAELVQLAEDVAQRLQDLALTDGEMMAWMGLTPSNDGRLALHATNLDLYAGLPGILVFLSSLARVSENGQWDGASHRVFRTIREVIRERKDDDLPIGAFNGCGGIIYALLVYKSVFPAAGVGDLIEGLIERISELVATDEERDIIGGAAGCAICLLRCHAATGDKKALELAIECGEKLEREALPQTRGVGWKVKAMTGDRPLTGMAHGNAGIAWALIELAAATGRDSFRELADQALVYERNLFSSEHKNWPDLRSSADPEEPPFVVGWCHGAAGIGLARLRCRHLGADENVDTEIEAALETTLSDGYGNGHCLCHGDLGNLEFLHEASLDGSRPGLRDEVQGWISRIMGTHESAGWICGVPAAVETPGLMNGLAGIGLGLLRLAEPAAIPSVLLLESPVGKS